jgi:succinate dehydrogenase/fumarate reductase flavoprotein subunit
MQVDATDIPHLQNARRSARSSFHVLGMAIRTAWDLAVYGHGTRLTGGNALAAGLLTALRKSGVTIWTNARVEKLIAKNGSVIGGQINRSGKEIAVHARRGVILATGGFGANGAMRARHIPLAEHGWSLQPGGNQGDGIRMGMEAGGQFIEENIANQIGMPMSAARRPDGSVKIAIHYAVDRHSPGSIVIDNQGQRFVNEATDYQKFTDMMRARGVGTAFLIGDHRFQRKYGMGLARPAPMPVGQFVSANYLLRGDTLEELAEKMGVNGRALAKTIAEFNKHARNGVDPAFQRGNDDYSKSMGDAGHKPNPCLAPLEDAPFYALAIHPGDVSTVCGLATDAHARVLNQDGAPIPGLYAAGLDMNSVFRGAYPGGGASIGAAITFAFIAASHLQS